MFKVTNLPVVSSLIYGSKWASNTWVGSRFPLEKITLEADDIDSQKNIYKERDIKATLLIIINIL